MGLGTLLVTFVVTIVVTLWMVERRNGDKRFWLILAILLGPLVLPFLLFIKPKSESKKAK